MRPSRFLALVGALLFAAVCAYFFCGLYGVVGGVATARVEWTSVSESVGLHGIAVRSEQLVNSSRFSGVSAEDGQRLPAGGVLAQGPAGELLTESSAVFFKDFDGLEYITAQQCEALTVASLEALMDSPPASTGSVQGRLVTDYVWYYAALTDTDIQLPQSGACTVAFDGFGGSVDGQIISVSAQEGGKRAVLLRLTCGGDYLKLRYVDAELIFARHSGFAMPIEAVRHDEKGDYVYIVSAGTAKREDVELIYSSDELCLTSGALTEGSIVVVSGGNIYEGCVLD